MRHVAKLARSSWKENDDARTAGTSGRDQSGDREVLRNPGLLPRPRRGRSGYRMYDIDDVTRLRFIKRAQELGFRLEEIQDLLVLRADTHASAAEVKERTEAKIGEVEGKIRDLRRVKRALQYVANQCSGEGTTGECPILEALEGGMRG